MGGLMTAIKPVATTPNILAGYFLWKNPWHVDTACQAEEGDTVSA
jgi:hypothetical protein